MFSKKRFVAGFHTHFVPLIGFSNNFTVNSFVTDPTDALAGIEIDSDGGVERFNHTGNLGDGGTWGAPLGTYTRADYDFRVDYVSGSETVLNGPSSNAVDTWHAGGSLIVFSIEDTGVAGGIRTFVGNLRMRPTGGGSDIGAARTLTLNAEVGV